MNSEMAVEVRSLVEPVFRLFRVALGRAPEAEAQRSFTERQREGAGFRDLAGFIAESAEFVGKHGPDAPPDRAYITRLHRFAFDREPQPELLATLLDEAGDGQDRVDLLVRVAELLRQDPASLARTLFPDGMRPEDDLAYQFWVGRYGTPGEQDMIAIDLHVGRMTQRPLFSLLLTAPAVRPDLVLETIASLERQCYPNWELCIGCPADMAEAALVCLQQAARRVPGLRLVGAEAGAEAPELLQAALLAADGQFVGMLDGGDQLAATALYEVAAALEQQPDLAMIYTDEDSLDGAGRRFRALFKPGWGSDMLLAGDCVGQLVLVRRERLDAVGGLRLDAGLFTRYDLLLRVVDGLPPSWVMHIPAVLFHRGRAPGRALPFPQVAATSLHPELRRVLDRHLAEVAAGGPAPGGERAIRIEDFLLAGGVWPRARFTSSGSPALVSILISTHEQPVLLERCVLGLLERTDYPAKEIIVADHDNRSLQARQALRRLQRHPAVRVIPVEGPFNWSAINNGLALEARGEILVLMNDDVDVIASDWLDEMVAQLDRPAVGISGACLLYPDDTLQHGGIVLSQSSAKHVLRSARQDAGYLGQLAMVRDLSAVTGACLAIRRAVFESVGGLSEALPLSCNDIDLCMRVRQEGLRVVWSPFALLHHVDGASRGHDRTIPQQASFRRSLATLQSKWDKAMRHDPYLNANLRATDHNLLLAEPPRRVAPWHRHAGPTDADPRC